MSRASLSRAAHVTGRQGACQNAELLRAGEDIALLRLELSCVRMPVSRNAGFGMRLEPTDDLAPHEVHPAEFKNGKSPRHRQVTRLSASS